MVMGFGMIFTLMGVNLSRTAADAYQNYLAYYNKSRVYRIASSAANIVASDITFTPNWRTGYSNINFMGGTYSAIVSDLDSGRVQVSVTAAYSGNSQSIVLTLGLTKFSKFAYYSVIEGAIYWATGDSVFGPLHTQQRLNINGNPVFLGKTTSKNGIYKNPASSKPEFLGGFQSGVSIDLPKDLTDVQAQAQAGGKYYNNVNVYIQFHPDGTATVREGSWTGTPTRMSLSALAPNGVLCANGGNLHIKGVVNGRITISALGSSGVSKGNVYVDSSVTYLNNPLTTSSTDMLGIVCDNNVIITDNVNNDNQSNGVQLHATMLMRSGGLTAENYATRGKCGTLTVLGGVQQYQRGPVGTISGGQISSGFNKNYRYDTRLMVDSPPLYPTTGSYEVLSWYE
jgi:hypothetical protein